MTEKQGGSDVRANTTRARAGRRGRLAAHRAQMVLLGADVGRLPNPGPYRRRASAAFSCRAGAGRERNAIQLMRLKDKLGNRANASAEIEYHGA